jgi:MFS family permease
MNIHGEQMRERTQMVNTRSLQWVCIFAGIAMTIVWMFDDQYVVGVGSASGGWLINSDTLTLAEFAWDIMHHDYAWRGFQLPHAPSLAPDIVVTILLQYLTGSWRWAYLIYAAFYLCSMTILAALIARSVVGVSLVRVRPESS